LPDFSIFQRRKCSSRENEQRDLRALTFENTSLKKYAESLPFVQRILNSNYSDRLKIFASQLLFGNIVNLDRGIFLPIDERPTKSKPLTKHMSDTRSAKELLRTDLLHMTSKEQDLTEFEPNSCVLVHYRSGAPPSRLHTFWRGPMQVISGGNSRYLLRDLLTHQEKEWLNYDESHDSWEPYAALRDTAKLHEYLRLHKLEKLIPQKFKT
jgi:hypothetical protein